MLRSLPFLRAPDAWQWAGSGLDASKNLLERGGLLAVASLAAAGLALALSHRGRAMPAVVGFWVVVLILAPAAQRTSSAPVLFYHLNEALPWTWQVGFRFDDSELASVQARTRELYATHRDELHALPASLPVANIAPVRRPNILMITLESFRHDMLTPEVMPHLWQFSQRGTRMTAHYATSNASHYGLFALLYGRLPLNYFAVLRSGEAPTLPAWLARWGYECHYLTSSYVKWAGMEAYLGPDHFTVETFAEGLPEERDPQTLARARAIFDAPGERPRLLFLFLMSTHFSYHYPSQAERFTPAARRINALEKATAEDRPGLLNRYRNAAHYVDSLLADWLETIDLERSLVVVTGDHGESLFDDGTIAHSSRLSDIQTRVPFVIAGPGIPPGRVVHDLTSHTDFAPTVLARLGVSAEAFPFDGHDLFAPGTPRRNLPLIHAKGKDKEREHLAFVSADARYTVRLFRDRGSALFLGGLGHDGRPERRSITRSDGDRFLAWFSDYLERRAPGLPPAVAAPGPSAP